MFFIVYRPTRGCYAGCRARGRTKVAGIEAVVLRKSGGERGEVLVDRRFFCMAEQGAR
jgi:hypothetical protein